MKYGMRKLEERIFALARRTSPTTRTGRIVFWAFAIAVVGFALSPLPRVGAWTAPWAWLGLTTGILGSIPGLFRWMRWRLLWRLRTRLIVTYLVIGLTPIALSGALAAIAGYVLFGQFANFAATSEIHTQLARLAANNDSLALHFQHVYQMEGQLKQPPGALPPAAPASSGAQTIMAMPELKTGLFADGKLVPAAIPAEHALTTVPTVPSWVHGNFSGLVLSQDHVYFRAVTQERAGAHRIAVITSLPLDAGFLSRIVSGLGRITLLPKVQIPSKLYKNGGDGEGLSGVDTISDDPSNPKRLNASDLGEVSGGVLPPRQNLLDVPITFPTTLETVQWRTGMPLSVVAQVTSRPSLLYQRLFQDSALTGVIRFSLIATAAIFACLELLAIFLASRLSRTITRSVSELYRATREVDQGRLNYRIQVTRRDQLAALSRSFNTMSESLARLLEQQKEKERMESELAIAQEVQANLFPAGDLQVDALEVHGLCRPARTVSGDYYDFLVLGDDAVCLALGDISGKGISAALLMAGLHSAVRAYRFASEEVRAADACAVWHGNHGNSAPEEMFQSPGNVLRLLNQHLYRSTQPEKYATLFIAHYSGASRALRYSTGGQLPPFVLRADGSVVRLDRGGTVVGLLDGVHYEEGCVHLSPGDLLIAYSDGVTEPENEFGDFGEARLVEMVHRNRHLPLKEISARVMQALEDWIGGAEQPDDITLVLARQN